MGLHWDGFCNNSQNHNKIMMAYLQSLITKLKLSNTCGKRVYCHRYSQHLCQRDCKVTWSTIANSKWSRSQIHFTFLDLKDWTIDETTPSPKEVRTQTGGANDNEHDTRPTIWRGCAWWRWFFGTMSRRIEENYLATLQNGRTWESLCHKSVDEILKLKLFGYFVIETIQTIDI